MAKSASAIIPEESPKSEAQSEPQPLFNETLKVALYASFGGRKTLQIGHLIEAFGAENVLVISAERGLGTIRSTVLESQVIPVNNLAGLRDAFQKASEFAKPDRWVCIDGMSQVMSWLANEQLTGAERYYDLKARNQVIPVNDLPFGRFMSDKGAIDSMRIYQRIGRDSENLLNAWITLPCNLYVNYLEEKIGSSGYERTLPYGPDVPGKVGLREVMSSFDFVGRLYYQDGKLNAGFDPTAAHHYLARTRDDRRVVEVPAVIEDFNLAEFVKLVKGEATANVANN